MRWCWQQLQSAQPQLAPNVQMKGRARRCHAFPTKLPSDCTQCPPKPLYPIRSRLRVMPDRFLCPWALPVGPHEIPWQHFPSAVALSTSQRGRPRSVWPPVTDLQNKPEVWSWMWSSEKAAGAKVEHASAHTHARTQAFFLWCIPIDLLFDWCW